MYNIPTTAPALWQGGKDNQVIGRLDHTIHQSIQRSPSQDITNFRQNYEHVVRICMKKITNSG